MILTDESTTNYIRIKELEGKKERDQVKEMKN